MPAQKTVIHTAVKLNINHSKAVITIFHVFEKKIKSAILKKYAGNIHQDNVVSWMNQTI